MAARVPILGQRDMRKTRGQAIEQRHDLVAARDRKLAARAEVVLNIDDQQNVAIAGSHGLAHDGSLPALSLSAVPAIRRSTAVASSASVAVTSTG